MKFSNPRTLSDAKARDLLVSDCGNYYITGDIAVRGLPRYTAWFGSNDPLTQQFAERLGAFSESSFCHYPVVLAMQQCEMHELSRSTVGSAPERLREIA